jgi:protoheme IX farnesyltransferase
MGWLYLIGTVPLGGYFLWLAWRLIRRPGVPAARRLYLYSLVYLMLLFGLMVASSVVG